MQRESRKPDFDNRDGESQLGDRGVVCKSEAVNVSVTFNRPWRAPHGISGTRARCATSGGGTSRGTCGSCGCVSILAMSFEAQGMGTRIMERSSSA